MKRIHFCSGSLLVWLLAMSPAVGQCWLWEDERLESGEGLSDDDFGHAVAASGSVMVATDRTWNQWQGMAVVFRRNGFDWVREQRLEAGDRRDFDQFGESVAVHGKRVVVGAVYGNGNAADTGTAYVFEHDGSRWNQTQELNGSDANKSIRFGQAVAVHGDVILVGAPGHNFGKGGVYVFRHNGIRWAESQIMAATFGKPDGFGSTLAMDGYQALVGAPTTDLFGVADAGVGFVWEDSGTQWNQTAVLTAADPVRLDRFSSAVSMRQGLAVVGAPNKWDPSGATGAVYVFRQSGTSWTQEFKDVGTLRSPSRFGAAVALDDGGSRFAVGAHNADGDSAQSGVTFLYRRQAGGWSRDAACQPTDGVALGALGYSVAFVGDVIFSGSPCFNFNPKPGAVYSHGVSDLFLTANQIEFMAGDALHLTTCAGKPGGKSVLYAIEVSDQPAFVRLDGGAFDGNGERSFGGTVPPNLVGLSVRLRAFGQVPSGRLRASAPREITFQ